MWYAPVCLVVNCSNRRFTPVYDFLMPICACDPLFETLQILQGILHWSNANLHPKFYNAGSGHGAIYACVWTSTGVLCSYRKNTCTHRTQPSNSCVGPLATFAGITSARVPKKPLQRFEMLESKHFLNPFSVLKHTCESDVHVPRHGHHSRPSHIWMRHLALSTVHS